MARLIDADKAVELLRNLGSRDYRREKGTIMDAIKMLSSSVYTPTVDAVPVVHGRWLYDSGSGKHFCSACDEFALSFRKDRWAVGDLYEVFLTDYCPNCGAKMDLEVE